MTEDGAFINVFDEIPQPPEYDGPNEFGVDDDDDSPPAQCVARTPEATRELGHVIQES
jgi:hypothetical protein